jgi:uracil-DNA glycosylase
VLVVGQAPSLTDSRTGSTFSGLGGKRLRAWLDQAGVPEEDVSFSALTKCYPGKSSGGKGDRAPTRVEIAACRPFLEREIRALRPRIVLLVGGMAVNELLCRAPLARLVGQAFDASESAVIADATDEPDSVSVVPLPHCSGASLWLNRPEHQALLADAIRQVRNAYASLTA